MLVYQRVSQNGRADLVYWISLAVLSMETPTMDRTDQPWVVQPRSTANGKMLAELPADQGPWTNTRDL